MTPPDPGWVDLAVRWFILVVLGLTTGLCFGQVIWRRGLRRVALFGYAALAAAASYSQLSLLGAPLTQRTWPFLVAAVVQVGYWLVLLFGHLDDTAVLAQLDEANDRITQLEHALTDAGLPVPPPTAAGGTP